MKVVHKKEQVDIPAGLLDRAKYFENNKDWENAIDAYEAVIKENPLHEFAYNRLMIIFRKEQEYRKEKSIIEKAIKAYEGFYQKRTKIHSSKKIISLSKAIMKSTGLADPRGKLVYQKEPLGKWNKRLLVVQKRLKGIA